MYFVIGVCRGYCYLFGYTGGLNEYRGRGGICRLVISGRGRNRFVFSRCVFRRDFSGFYCDRGEEVVVGGVEFGRVYVEVGRGVGVVCYIGYYVCVCFSV